MEKKQTTDRYTLADLENWSAVAGELEPPVRLGIFGDPVAHSLSPQMQNAALRACEIGMQYARFHIRTNELRSALLFLRTLDFVGINVTVPHKIAAFKQVDETDESAARAEAVNTIRVRDEKLIGSNTDGEGFLRAIRTEFSIDLRDLRVMIIGAGGSSKPALFRAATEVGARGANGFSMLLHQGALSFSPWFDREARIEAMRAVLYAL